MCRSRLACKAMSASKVISQAHSIAKGLGRYSRRPVLRRICENRIQQGYSKSANLQGQFTLRVQGSPSTIQQANG